LEPLPELTLAEPLPESLLDPPSRFAPELLFEPELDELPPEPVFVTTPLPEPVWLPPSPLPELPPDPVPGEFAKDAFPEPESGDLLGDEPEEPHAPMVSAAPASKLIAAHLRRFIRGLHVRT
jgi:hypothetical protein